MNEQTKVTSTKDNKQTKPLTTQTGQKAVADGAGLVPYTGHIF